MLRPPRDSRGTEAAFRPGARRLVVLAQTGGDVWSFGPFVAAMLEDGRVLYAAKHTDGSTGVWAADDSGARAVVAMSPRDGAVTSHPDADGGGTVCFYARGPDASTALWLARDGRATRLATDCGPLGPTMNAAGHVVYRTDAHGAQGVHMWDGRTSHRLDAADGTVACFEGLPVVAGTRVVWRATMRDGSHQIRLWDGEERTTIAASGGPIAAIARFPMIDRHGRVVYVVTSGDGIDSLHLWQAGDGSCVKMSGAGFESIRGGLISDSGTLLIIGTPRGSGGVGVYADAMGQRPVIQIGSTLGFSTVTEFAVNPVSVNARDQVAIRATLADGREVIARSDPIGTSH